MKDYISSSNKDNKSLKSKNAFITSSNSSLYTNNQNINGNIKGNSIGFYSSSLNENMERNSFLLNNSEKYREKDNKSSNNGNLNSNLNSNFNSNSKFDQISNLMGNECKINISLI